MPDLRAGTVTRDAEKDLLASGYRIESTIGRGGMGEVFLAWDERLHRHVAIKRIRSDLPVAANHRSRFRREARTAARLTHPAIVQVFDILDFEHGDCIVMERVEGHDLAEAIARREVDAEAAVRLAAEIAGGLAEAHAKGLVHRDLKPENVILTTAGHAKILDFGLARMLWSEPAEDDAGADPSAVLTQAGALVGTVHAMSPEQAGGRPVDHRSDLFALGGLLYQMLTGRAPFLGDNWLDTLRRVSSEQPVPLAELRPELPGEVVDLVQRLLAKEPSARPPNARVVAQDLERLRPSTAGLGAWGASSAGDSRQTARRDEAERGESAPYPPKQSIQNLPTREISPGLGQTVEQDSEPQPPVDDEPTTVLRVLVQSRLSWPDADDVRRFRVRSQHDRAARDLLARHDGLEIDAVDGVSLLFERADQAVTFALAYHQALARLSQALDCELSARVGIHLGQVLLRHNRAEDVSRGARPVEVAGAATEIAARLRELARERQTLLDRAVFDLARRTDKMADEWTDERTDERTREAATDGAVHWLAHGTYVLRDLEEPLDVFEVGVDGFAPLAQPPDTDAARRVVAIGDELVLGWRPAVGQKVPRRQNWRLERRLGEGGFGEVWLARHESGERRVFKFCFEAARLRALKREVTLFRLLKEALGHRDDIARILDWNFDDAPYFLESEYTEGGSLVEWAEEQGGLDTVPIGVRLELVAEVAEALGAAHSVGILHKDVKPENVLVTTDRDGAPHARLTDFGIGLLTDRRRLDAPGFTAHGFTETLAEGSSTSGTLGYLAPELVEGKAASVQADVYSLGVLLYQVVVGDLSRTLAPGWDRDVQDEILAEDLGRFVDGRPERRPASAGQVAERLRTLDARRAERRAEAHRRAEDAARIADLERQTRRRRLASLVAAAALVVAAVVTFLALEARHEGRRATREANTASYVSDFLVELFRSPDPFRGQGGTTTVREMLDIGARRIETDLADQPEIQAALMYSMASAYKNIGLLEPALDLAEQSLKIRQRVLGDDDPDTAHSRLLRGDLRCRGLDADGAVGDLRQSLAVLRTARAEESGLTEALLAASFCLHNYRGELAAAEDLLREAVAVSRERFGDDHPDGLEARHRLALLLADRGHQDEALELLRDVLERKRAAHAKPVELALVRGNLSRLLWLSGHSEEAELVARENAQELRRVFGDEHPMVGLGLNIVGEILRSQGRLQESEPFLQAAVDGHRLRDESSIRTAASLTSLAALRQRQRRCVEAEPLLAEASMIYTREKVTKDHWRAARLSAVRGACAIEFGRFEDARALLEGALPILEDAFSRDAPQTREVEQWIAELYAAWGRSSSR